MLFLARLAWPPHGRPKQTPAAAAKHWRKVLKKAEELERLLDHYPRWRDWDFRKEIPDSNHSAPVGAPHPPADGRLN